MRGRGLVVAALAWAAVPVRAEPPPDAGADAAPGPFAVHYQATVATQWHPSFAARYSGPNSLPPGEESATSVVSDAFLGARLWRGAEGWFQPELSGGRGLGGTLGVAAFPSGEVYRVGNVAPTVVVARAFVRQRLGLGGGTVGQPAGQTQLPRAQDRDGLTLTVGKLATTDLVDALPPSSDPHTGFMSWGLFASAAYDYPADTRGYTWGAAADLTSGRWSARAGIFLEPRAANGMQLDPDASRAHGLVAEGEVRFTLLGRPGAARALAYLNRADMGSYREALAVASPVPDVAATRRQGRTKHGVAASANAGLGGGLDAFLRASWNDGATETWAFTEVDRSLAGGLVQSGARWGRPGDEAGAAAVVSGLSDLHRRYLAAGGRGFMLGDGGLSYAPELLAEVYYRAAITRELSAGVAWQPIVNPGFNSARGPVQVLTGRVHVAF